MDTRIVTRNGHKGTMSAPIDSRGSRVVTLAGRKPVIWTGSQVKASVTASR